MKTTTLLASSILFLTTAASAAPATQGELGLQVQVLPKADATIRAQGDSITGDFETSFAVAGQLGGRLTPNLSLAFAPRFAFEMSQDGAANEGDWSQLDLAARLTAHAPLEGSKVELFGYVAPGYSIIFLPDSPDEDVDIGTPHGLVLGIGAGVAVAVSPSMSVVGDMGYSWGFQSTSVSAQNRTLDVDLSTDLLHVGLGIRNAF